MNRLTKLFLSIAVIFLPVFPSYAGTNDSGGSHNLDAMTSGIYVKGRKSLQVVSGLLFSPTALADRNKGINAFGGFLGITFFFER